MCRREWWRWVGSGVVVVVGFMGSGFVVDVRSTWWRSAATEDAVSMRDS